MKVKTIAFAVSLLLISLPVLALAFDLATKITRTGDTVKLESVGYAKLGLLKEETSLTGSIVATGKLSVTGTANIVMWSKVEGSYYFSKMPALQKIKDKKDLDFKIPFNASNKMVTEVIIEVEMMGAGDVSISGISVRNS